MTPAATCATAGGTGIGSAFQSSAGFDPGRYKQKLEVTFTPVMFQSSAGFDPGRYGGPPLNSGRYLLFQSSAGFDPGRYDNVTLTDADCWLVSILGRV